MSGPFIDQVDQEREFFGQFLCEKSLMGPVPSGSDNDVEQYIPRLLSGLNFPSIKQQTCNKTKLG